MTIEGETVEINCILQVMACTYPVGGADDIKMLPEVRTVIPQDPAICMLRTGTVALGEDPSGCTDRCAAEEFKTRKSRHAVHPFQHRIVRNSQVIRGGHIIIEDQCGITVDRILLP